MQRDGQIDQHTEKVLALLEELPELAQSAVRFGNGETILEEGDANDRLYILMEGKALLSKCDSNECFVSVDTFGPGSLLGLTSFWTREPVYARITSQGFAECVSISREQFDSLHETHPGFSRTIQGLFVYNLSNRYRHVIKSNVERDSLSRQLTIERNQLRDTLTRLEQTTNRLLNQEKLATMGQLMAGIAHEINNPVGALLRGVENATEALEEAYKSDAASELEGFLLREGLKCPFWSSEEKRARMGFLQKSYPKFGRPILRRLAQLTESAYSAVESEVLGDELTLRHYLAAYELGVSFRAVRISSERIEKIVTGLKNYGRQTGGAWVEADLVQGIRDTLTVLNNRLRFYELNLDLEEIKPFTCNLGEINQVWTNLLVNAMDATPKGGSISIAVKAAQREIVVCISDTGTGIPEDKLETIFKPNFTSKNQSGSYGLGLGLSISRDVVEKHGGTLVARNSEPSGAVFEARLPIETSD